MFIDIMQFEFCYLLIVRKMVRFQVSTTRIESCVKCLKSVYTDILAKISRQVNTIYPSVFHF